MNKFKEILDIPDIKYIIISFLKEKKCKWCLKSQNEIINKKKGVSLFTNGICNDCLIKEYSSFM
jgi:hypothetical protein